MHTIPYPSNNHTLSLSTEYYSSELINSKSVFDRVTDLSILYEMMQTSCLSYYANVKIFRSQAYSILKSFICLSNRTALWINRNYSLKSSPMMIEFLTEGSNVSS